MARPRGRLASTPEEVVAREEKVWELRIKGKTQINIAKEVGITQSAVSDILDRLHKRYRSALDQDVARVQEEQILILQHIADEALDAWEKDLQETRSGRQFRNPAYVSSAMAALADIRKITGIKPKDDSDQAGNGKDALEAVMGILDAAREARNNSTSS